MDLQVGQVLLRRYLVDRLVGQGTLGRVYEARDQQTEQRFAVRTIESQFDNEPIAAFNEIEAKVAGQLGSVQMARFVESGKLSTGERCVVTELMQGETLAKKSQLLGCMSDVGVIQLLKQLLSGLAVAHAAGVVHRDLTPRSIFIEPEQPGVGELVKLVDFGVTRLMPQLGSAPNSINDANRGSLQYLSPEQLNGLKELDPRSNIYSLGVIAYEALSGKLPFIGDSFSQLRANILLDDPTPIERLVPEISPALAKLIRKAMARVPSARFPSAQAMLAAITGKAEGSNAPQSVANPARAAAVEAPTASSPAATESSSQASGTTDAVATVPIGAVMTANANAAVPNAAVMTADVASQPAQAPPPPMPPIDWDDEAGPPRPYRSRQSTSPGIQPESTGAAPPDGISLRESVELAPLSAQHEPESVPVEPASKAVARGASPVPAIATAVDSPKQPTAARTEASPVRTDQAKPKPEKAKPEREKPEREKPEKEKPEEMELGQALAHAEMDFDVQPTTRSQRPLHWTLAALALLLLGTLVVLLVGRSHPSQTAQADEKTIVDRQSPSAATNQLVSKTVLGAPSATTLKPAIAATSGDASATAAPDRAVAASARTKTKPQPLVREAQGSQKPPTSSPSGRKSTLRGRDSGKDPYNYR